MNQGLRRFPFVLGSFFVIAAIRAVPAAAQDVARSDSVAVVAAARHWVELLDAGKDEEAFEQAAPLLQQMAGSAQNWRNFVSQARADVPNPIERELFEYEPHPDLAAAPAGEYRSVGFRVGTGPLITETVVLESTDDGWKVAMYGVRGPQ